MIKHVIGFLLATFGTLALSCTTSDLSVKHINESSKELEAVSVQWDSFETVAGVLPPGVSKSNHYVPLRLPEVVEVRWQTPDGVLHEELIQVPRAQARPKRGEVMMIIVTFTDSGVKVTARAD